MKVALITMPLAAIEWPSIQIGILKSHLLASGVSTDDFYFNLEFAKVIDPEFYLSISDTSHFLLGEWLFSIAAHGPSPRATSDYFDLCQDRLRDCASDLAYEQLTTRLQVMREKTIPNWIEELAASGIWEQYDIIGFSCTFAQLNASFALAKRLKQTFPKVKIIFGGSSLEGAMGQEIERNCSFIDCVVQREGEHPILEIVSNVKNGVALPRLLEATEAVKMDELGVPNYESYYGLLRSNLELSRLEAEGKIGTLAFETSRGCWWGQKQHCTFCGLNGAQLTYREKSSDRVLSEMQELCEKYDRYDFLAVDSILSLNAFKTLLPDLISSETNFKIFSELKANLTIDQLSLLREAGFQILQPGIESLSTEVLKLMKKGVTGTQNIHLLRWAQNFGLKVLWNILYGFPGESHEAYAEALTVLPKLRHLQPPVGANRIRLDRFSPNFKRHFEGAGEFASVRPLAYYEYCFPAVWNLNNLAYSFESIAIRSAPQELYSQLEYLVKDWQKAWAEPLSRPQLIFKRALASGHVLDSRFGGPKTIELSGDYFDIACVLDKTPLTLIGLSEKLNLPAEIVDSACEELSKLDLVLKLDGRLTWLPLREPISPGF